MSIGLSSFIGVWALLAFVVIAVLAVFQGYVKRQSLVARDNLFRLGAIAMLAIALCGPVLNRNEYFARGTILVDVSESMDEAIAENLLMRAKTFAGPHAELEVVAFAKSSESGGIPSGSVKSFAALRSSSGKLNIGATSLEEAFQGLLSSEEQNVLLVSDGFETEGGAAKMLPQLQSRNNKIYPLLPPDAGPTTKQFAISKLHAPLVAAAKKSVEIRTSIVNSTDTPQVGTLQIKHGDKVVLTQEVKAAPGEEALVLADSDPLMEGIKEITATLVPKRKEFSTSIQRIYLSGEEREKVLMVSGALEDERVLAQVFKDEAYQLKSIVAGTDELARISLSDYGAVLLNNIEKDAVPRKLLDAIPQYVRDGGGFVMIGGNKSFGLGGYIDSVIEPVLPVELVPPQTEKKRLNVALALIIDKSGSMTQGSRLDYAKEAAVEVVRNLKDDDFISVIGFDDAPFVVLKMSPVGEIRAQAEERIGRLFAAGRTNLIPAMDEARRGLARAEAGRKHMIVLTDGRLPDEGFLYIDLTKQLRLMGITLSTIMLGGDSDYQFLKSLADVGGGGFYQTSDARNLPRIFLQDVRVSGGERTMKEASQYDVRVGNGQLSSTKLRSFPPVKGYVQTKVKNTADLELVALAQDKAEPLLASWRFGQGKAIAFTSDANGRWSSLWVGWPKFYQFWTEVLESLRTGGGPRDQAPIRFNLRTAVEQGALKLALEVFGDRDPGEISVTLKLPDGGHSAVVFSRAAKGLYEAEVKSPIPGRYELGGMAGNSKLTPVAFHISGEHFGERKGQGFNIGLLERVASETGGVVNPTKEQLSSFTQVRKRQTELSPWFVALGMMMLVLWVFFREVPTFRVRFKVAAR